MKDRLQYLKIFGLIFFLLLPSLAFAEAFYQPGTPVGILTEILTGDLPGNQPVTRKMIVGPVQIMDKSMQVRFCGADTGVLIGNLEIPFSGKINWDVLKSTTKQFQSDNLFIVPGFTIPVDVLPVARFLAGADSSVFELHRQVHGRTFVDRIRIFAYAVSKEQAQQSQWIRFDGDVPSEFFMIEAVDAQTEKLIVRQLWMPGTAWWLFEQTPFRRSWRIQ